MTDVSEVLEIGRAMTGTWLERSKIPASRGARAWLILREEPEDLIAHRSSRRCTDAHLEDATPTEPAGQPGDQAR